MLYCKNPKCYKENGCVSLIEDDVDDRQEWCRISYHCSKCNTCYVRRIDYKTQSSLVASDVLYLIDEKRKEIEVE
jgi:hypothetical protein